MIVEYLFEVKMKRGPKTTRKNKKKTFGNRENFKRIKKEQNRHKKGVELNNELLNTKTEGLSMPEK
jgi:hypothetical protein